MNFLELNAARTGSRRLSCVTVFCLAAVCAFFLVLPARGQNPQPIVAIHDSELTRFLDSTNAPAVFPTPTNAGTTGRQWWINDWRYFVIPDSTKEAMRSDGTPFVTVGDSNIIAGVLLTNGIPKYPILISLASEAIRDDEIAPLTNYVAAGGFLLVGSSSFTRNTNGTTRGDFAFANELGIHLATSSLTNWIANRFFTKTNDHRLVNHVPPGQMTWRLPTTAEEINWGISPVHPFLGTHDAWKVVNSNATVLAVGDVSPYLVVKQYGKGWFVYYAAMQPLIGHSNFQPSMYSYMIFRRAIEWAFETMNLPLPKLSPWPYPYDATFMVRHDLENFTNEMANVAASAQFEFTNGAWGDYYLCTGTVRDDAPTPATIIAGLRQAATNYGATIGPHNGGLKNPNNPALVRGDYDYWHWGPDEALDVTNPPPAGYASGKAYALTSMSNSYADVEGWLAGITNPVRTWSSCNFNGTREDSYDIQSQLNIKIAGDQKLTPFPHWTLSTRTPGLRYGFLSEPVSEWFVGGLSAQSLEPWHPPGVHTLSTLHDGVDFYYKIGALIGFYSHTLSTGLGDAGNLAPEFVTYGVNSFYHPRLWSTNATGIYYWWLQRSNAQVTVTHTTNGYQSISTFSITGSSNTNNAVELLVPGSGSAYGLQVFTNNVLDPGGSYRTNGSIVKVRVGTAITNAQVRYVLGPRAQNDNFSATNGVTLSVPASGVLTNDTSGLEPSISAVLVSGPSKGSVALNTNGSFIYRPTSNFIGSDVFTYQAFDGLTNASTAAATILLSSADTLYNDNFTRSLDPAAISPWVAQANAWTITGGALRGSPDSLNTYGFAYLTNYSASNYAVQARIQFGARAYGGGLGARLNSAVGSHYAAWIYPENSQAGSNRLRLVKFQNYSTFSYNGGSYMADLPLASVGTNGFHSVKLAMFGTRIAMYFDGVQMASVTDVEAQPYLNGGIIADLWTGSATYNMLMDDVAITPLVVSDGYFVNQDTNSFIPAPGVLGNDSPVFGTNLTAILVTGPTNGSLTLNSDGSFSYTPATNYLGPDSFTYQANDGSTNLGTATVAITVLPVNHPPVLLARSNITVNATLAFTVTNTATDTDLPAQLIAYALTSVPAPATNPPTISTNGIISWTPGQTQGGTYTLTTVATDNGSHPLSATNSFTVTVKTNSAPFFLATPSNRTVVPLVALTITNTASDNDVPPNTLSYMLLNPPAGATITNGVIFWTPSQAQDFTTNIIASVVTDNGIPPFSATNSFIIAVNDSALLAVNSSTLVLEGCPPTNNAVDPGETVTMLFALRNSGLGSTTNLVATLLETNGVVSPSGPQNYGVVPASGGIVTQSFTFTASGSCGGTISPTFRLQDNALDLGSITSSITLGPLVNISTQTFENVTAPALPAGWTSTSATNNVFWTTTTNQAATGTNSAFVRDTNFVSSSELVSPLISLPAGQSQLCFRHRYQFETNATALHSGYDGSVVEIIFGTNGWRDILVAGGAFVSSNGYNATIVTGFGNPLAGRSGWTGTNNNFSNVVINLPLAAAGTNIQLRWRIGTDNGQNSGGWWVDNIGISAPICCVHIPPVLATQTNRTIDELTALSVTNSATDASSAPGTLNYSLTVSPVVTNASISANGVISWTPTEDQGPGVYVFTTVVTDSTASPLSATNSFQVTVNEVNLPPQLPHPQPDRTIIGLSSLSVTNTATDPDIPANALVYALTTAPTNAVIGTNGIISWTPAVAQVPSVVTFTTVVTDTNPAAVNSKQLTDTNSFTVTVQAIHNGPSLPVQTNRIVDELTQLVVTNAATANDIPPRNISYQLLPPAFGATIDTNGVILWRPTEAQGPGSYTLTAVATDDDPSPKSATNFFQVTVNEINLPPQLPSQSDRTVVGVSSLTVTNTATDSDLPTNSLTYVLTAGPTNAAIDTNGIITWTPIVAQVPGIAVFTTVATDTNPAAVNSKQLSNTNTFTVTVQAIHNGPILPAQTNRTVDELTQLVVTNASTGSDIPPRNVSYQLLPPAFGATIDTNGVILWTPTEAQGPGSYTLTTVATDDDPSPRSATNSFQVTVNEINLAPQLSPQSDQIIVGLASLTVTNTATDPDVPTNSLTYTLTSGPTNATIDTNGVISWTPTVAQVPGFVTFTTVVTDTNPAAVNSTQLTATNAFTVTVQAIHNGPSLPAQTNRAVDELTELAVTNTATANDVPPRNISYQILPPVSGANIDTNGVIRWTPGEAEGPGSYTLTTVATDDDPSPKSATNSFLVTVNEINLPPRLPAQSDRTIAGLTPLIVTNTATDPDFPGNSLSYSLATGPTNAAINFHGVITWTPTVAQVPGIVTFTTIVTDKSPVAVNITELSATNTFTVTVQAIHNGPTLPAQTNRTVDELTQLVVTNAAAANDVPPRNFSYQLLPPAFGATIDTNGVIHWTPSEPQGPGAYTLTTVATDDDPSPKSATNSFDVTVNEVNSAPLLAAQPDLTIAALSPLIVTNAATDADLPANHLFYTLVSAPTNAVIDTNGVITWTPTADQSFSTNLFATLVTDDGIPPLNASNSFFVIVNAMPASAPVIQAISVTSNLVTIVWSAVRSHTYRLQYLNLPFTNQWSNVIPDILATGDTASATNTPDSAQRIYRVQLVQ